MGLIEQIRTRRAVGGASAEQVPYLPAGSTSWTTVKAALDRVIGGGSSVWLTATDDGSVDVTDTIQSALDSLDGGGTLWVPAGIFYCAGAALSVPANVSVRGVGRGATIFRVQAGRNSTLFDLDGVNNVYLADFSIDKASGAAATTASFAIRIRGAFSRVTVERVTIGGEDLPASGVAGDGFENGVHVAGNEGTNPGTGTGLTLRDVESNNSPLSWGFHLAHVQSAVVDNCRGKGNLLDGLKLYQKCYNTRIFGGDFSYNGHGYTINPALYAGDGMDLFGGGDTTTVIGTVCRYNYGNGATDKTGDTTNYPAATWGYKRRSTYVGVDFSNNTFTGLYLAMNDPLDLTEPVPNRASIHGTFDGNGQDGVYLNARNVTLCDGATMKGNGRYGIVAAARAFDVSIGDVTSVANATANLEIIGASVRTRGGTYYGVDPDLATVPGDLASATPVSTYCIAIASTASDVHIDNPTYGYQSGPLAINVGMTSGTCMIHTQGAFNPFTTSMMGGHGSTHTRAQTGGLGVSRFIKNSAPNLTTGWLRETPIKASATVNVTQTTIAHGCGYAPAQVAILPKGDARVWQSQAPDATNVYLTASSSVSVDIFAH